MLRSEKENFVSAMKENLGKAAGVLFVDFTGLTVAEVEQVRCKFRAENVGYQVVKNTLMAKVLADTNYATATEYLKGSPTGVVLGYDDPVTSAKLTFELLEDIKHLRVKGGIVDEQAIDAKAAEALSKMPTKEELQAGIIALAMSPGRRLLAQVNNPAGLVVGAIDKLVENLGGE